MKIPAKAMPEMPHWMNYALLSEWRTYLKLDGWHAVGDALKSRLWNAHDLYNWVHIAEVWKMEIVIHPTKVGGKEALIALLPTKEFYTLMREDNENWKVFDDEYHLKRPLKIVRVFPTPSGWRTFLPNGTMGPLFRTSMECKRDYFNNNQ